MSPDFIESLNGLPAKEALRRPLNPAHTGQRRVANLLAGAAGEDASMTIGDAIFRWARVEPEALAEAEVVELQRTSDLVAAAGRLPKRFSLGLEATRSAANLTLTDLPWPVTETAPALATSYLMQRLVGHLFNAQDCEAQICGLEADPGAMLINGLSGIVPDPRLGPPEVIDRLTFITEDLARRSFELQNNPLVCVLSGFNQDMLASSLPGGNAILPTLFEGLEVVRYANAAAQAGRMLLRRDAGGIMNVASLASTSVAGHIGGAAGYAAFAALGLTGSWLFVLAPLATSFAGRIAAKNLARRARFHFLCRHEVEALNNAVRHHCLASRDALQANMAIADSDAVRFRDMHGAASGTVKDCIEDWLQRMALLSDFRRLNADRFHRASLDPGILDPVGGDPLAAAQESLLSCGRVGLHPANVAATAEAVVAASQALGRKLQIAVI